MPFEVVVPEVKEIREGAPEQVVLENARRKARAGLRQVGEGLGQAGEGARAGLGHVGEGLLVLGVDTEVVLDGRVLGKPADEAAARMRLEALSARTHEVLSGVALVAAGLDAKFSDSESFASSAAGPGERVGVARSYVTFRELDERTIGLYLRSGEWRDRAGAYAIQGLGAILVERLQGDFSNVVGLPVALLLELAPEFELGGKTL